MILRKKDIFSGIILTIFYTWYFYFLWIIKVLEDILWLIIFILILWMFYTIGKKIFRSKSFLSPANFISRVVFVYAIFISILVGSIWLFSYYYNEKSPSYLKEYTISNWEKTVVFQEMMHIWWKDFYENVSKNLKNYKSENFVHFFEWVWDWTEENKKEFNQALWFDFDENLYPNVAKLLKLEFQDYKKIIWEISEKDINVDISIDEIMEEYRKSKTPNSKNEINFSEVSKELDKFLKTATERQINLISYIWQAFLNYTLANMSNIKIYDWNLDIMNVILDKRDKNLADAIINSPEEKIYVTYGALHFPWVLKYLQENDTNWKIEKETKIKVL